MTMIIATHNGKFHADEVTGYAILSYIFPENELTRTREEDVIQTAHIVIDVGKVYEPKNGRFDHHQESCKETYSDKYTTLLSSAGMVFKEYGTKFIKAVLADKDTLDDKIVELTKEYIYKYIIQPIDGWDNGIPEYPSQLSGQRNYPNNWNISYIVNLYNNPNVWDYDAQLDNFIKASNYIQSNLILFVESEYEKLFEYNNDYEIISRCMKSRTNEQIIVVDIHCENWLTSLKEYEKDNGIEGIIKYIIYPDYSGWRIKTIVTDYPNHRRSLAPETFLKERISKPDDLVFVHKALFIGGAKTLECAMEMGELSLID